MAGRRQFDIALKGYERTQVDLFLARVEAAAKAGVPLTEDVPRFTLVLRGYDRGQVDRRLDELRRQAEARAGQSRRYVAHGPGPGGVPGLLREVADSLEAEGPLAVRDIVYGIEGTDDGGRPALTVYFGGAPEGGLDTPGAGATH